MGSDDSFTVLSIGGSDPTGGAGVQGDLKTFAAHGAEGTAVLTALTAQNADGVFGVVGVAPAFVRAQLEALYAQVVPSAVKTGMLLDPETVATVAGFLEGRGEPLVVDPVLRASSGGDLAKAGLLEALEARLLPIATLSTPNWPESAAALGRPVTAGQASEAALALRARWGCAAVLLKGGHGEGTTSVDWLATREGLWSLSLPRLSTPHGHGSGCALSASLAVRLGRGLPLLEAVVGAKAWLHRALEAARPLGRGRGPVRHDVPTGRREGGPTVQVERIR